MALQDGDTPRFLDIQYDSSLDIRSHPESGNLWLVDFRGASFQPAVTYGYHGSVLMIVSKKTLEAALLGTLLPTVMLKQRFKGL